jgi:hypothetical protein
VAPGGLETDVHVYLQALAVDLFLERLGNGHGTVGLAACSEADQDCGQILLLGGLDLVPVPFQLFKRCDRFHLPSPFIYIYRGCP